MSENQFFEKKGPFPLKDILKVIGYRESFPKKNDLKIQGLKSLDEAEEFDITFLNSTKYKNSSTKTKAAACITSLNLTKFLPEKCIMSCLAFRVLKDDELQNFWLFSKMHSSVHHSNSLKMEN